MMRGPMKHQVTVWGKNYEVTVNQKSKTVWEAVGSYEGRTIRVNDRSESTAVKRWVEAARYQGNG
jgi:hypothetical protein